MPKHKNGHAAEVEPTIAINEPDPAAVDVAAETLTGDLRDFILDRLRHEQSKRPWHERGEADQRDTVHQVESAVRSAVRQAVEIIAAGGLKTIKASIEQVTVKDGIKAVLTMSKFDEHRHNLIDATGQTVLIVVADPEDFSGERAPVEIKPDQSEMLDEAIVVVHSEPDHAAPFH
jgi:hypothetical protein